MKIKFLGTGASEGTPAVFCECDVCRTARERKGKYLRTRSGLVIDERLMIDFSPDAYTNSVKYELRLSAIKTLLMTHSHEDHLYTVDLATRLSKFCLNRIEDILHVYGGAAIETELKKYAWQRNAEFTRNLLFTQVEAGKTYTVEGGYKVTAYPTEHMIGEECYVYLIEKDGKSYFHCHDSGVPYDWVLKKMSKDGVKLNALSFDCTYGLIEKEYGGHMNLNQNIRVKAKMVELGLVDEKTLCYATHIAHCGGQTDEIEKKALENGIQVAYDGWEITL